MLLLSPYGYVSRWGVRFWFQNRYFKGKYGYLSLRHSHMCTLFNVWNLAGLLSFWIYIYTHFETCTCFFSSTSFSLTRFPLRRPGSADNFIPLTYQLHHLSHNVSCIIIFHLKCFILLSAIYDLHMHIIYIYIYIYLYTPLPPIYIIQILSSHTHIYIYLLLLCTYIYFTFNHIYIYYI